MESCPDISAPFEGHLDTELEAEFIGDPLLAPSGILASHLADEIADIPRERWPAALTGFPAPQHSEGGAMPSDESFQFCDHQGVLPVEESRKGKQFKTAGCGNASRTSLAFLEEGELFT